jgi:adenosylhomocysteine nucleosidase
MRWRSLLAAGVLAIGLAGCAGVYKPAGTTANGIRLDDTPRIAVISAFEPELKLLLSRLEGPARHSVNGVEFTTGTLEGKPVVLFLSGISMTNATMNTQLVLDRFRVTS